MGGYACATRGRRGLSRSYGREPRGGCIRSFGPVRAPAPGDGGLGGICAADVVGGGSDSPDGDGTASGVSSRREGHAWARPPAVGSETRGRDAAARPVRAGWRVGTTEPGHRVGVYGDAGGLRRLERLSAGRPGLAEPHAGGEVAGSLALRVLGSRESSGDARFADRAGRGGRREHAPKHWVGSEPGLRLRAREHPHASRGVAEVPPHGPLDEGRCRQLEFYLGPIDQPWPDVRCSPWRGSPGACSRPGLGLVLPAKLGPQRDGVRSWRPVRSALSGCLEPQDGSWSHVPACSGTVSAA